MNLVFDLDDTLIKTTGHYINTEKYFINLLKEKGIPSAEARELSKQTDLKLISEHKYGYHWYQQGLIDVYKILSKKYKIIIDDIENLLEQKVALEFKTKRELWDNAQEILIHFKKLDYTMFIMTLGDYNVQMSKIKNTNIGSYFKEILVVSKKDDEDYKYLINKTKINPRKSWFIGNSIANDIIPAQRAGFKCVLFDKHTTFYGEKMDVPENTIVISDLIELKNIIKNR